MSSTDYLPIPSHSTGLTVMLPRYRERCQSFDEQGRSVATVGDHLSLAGGEYRGDITREVGVGG